VRFERWSVRFMSLAAEEPLPYGRGGICQFLLMILILLMIFPEGDDFSQDQEHDQDHEQEADISRIARAGALWNNEAAP
jgi:hypothetical protein